MRTFEGIAIPEGTAWNNLLAHFLSLDDHRKMPAGPWYKQSQQLIAAIGEKEFIDLGLAWLLKCIEKSTINQRNIKLGLARSHEKITETLLEKGSYNYGQQVPAWVEKVYGGQPHSFFFPAKAHVMNKSSNYFYYSFGGRILRGFIHCTPLTNSKEMLQLVDRFVSTNPNECADALHVYTQLPVNEGVPRITRIRAKSKKKNIQTRVDTTLKQIGKKLKISADQLEEMTVPDYDLNGSQQLIRQIGDYMAWFTIESVKKTTLVWEDVNGKMQAAVPAKVKSEFAEELKELKADIKDIENQLPVQKNRLEDTFLKNRTWTFGEWFPLYIQHPLMAVLTHDLIWHFNKNDQKTEGIWNGKEFIDVNDQPISWLDDETQVQLWHPIGFQPDYILRWREHLVRKQITQPIKQAFREVYIITDAELNTMSYSNRFAAHILNRDQFGALCRVRGWVSAMATGLPTKRLPNWDLMAEYWVSEIWLGESSKIYGSAHISTDQVRFYRDKVQIDLTEVPALVFSEIMRDIDMFTGVCSIANDPNWQAVGDGTVRNYWNLHAFGNLNESAKVREQALRNLIPRLKIGPKCSFEGKFLKVQGHIRNYKIHMGSGNILMEPNDQYLCIVPDRSAEVSTDKLYLPFEGDKMLSIIVSKAMLLADDNKITDSTISRQIRPA